MNFAASYFGGAFSGKSVMVTGHTGFKGAWLCEWLLGMGARVHGFALNSPTQPALFEQLGLEKRIESHQIGDIRDGALVWKSITECEPDYVFHLAAQPIVLASYTDPEATWTTNVNGTIHVLEALRRLSRPSVAVIVSSDKCYENRETGQAYTEEDSLGGYDPYSASKGAVEVAVSAWRRSFFMSGPVKIASARAGNVIGGGDWAPNRIVPDSIRSLSNGLPIGVRNRFAVRPWQHVLEPLSGYLWLAANLAEDWWRSGNPQVASATAFNFGPDVESSRSVRDLVEEILTHWQGSWIDQSDPKAVHEAHLLGLATAKAATELGWHPAWHFADAVRYTVEWYQSTANGVDPVECSRSQISRYFAAAALKKIAWAV